MDILKLLCNLKMLFLKLGPLEEKVMEIIWDFKDEVKVRYVWKRLNTYAYTTILTIFQKLERKGFISGEVRGKVKYYKALIGRDEYHIMKIKKTLVDIFERNPNAIYLFFSEMGINVNEVLKKMK